MARVRGLEPPTSWFAHRRALPCATPSNDGSPSHELERTGTNWTEVATCPCSARSPCVRRPASGANAAVARTRAPARLDTPPAAQHAGRAPAGPAPIGRPSLLHHLSARDGSRSRSRTCTDTGSNPAALPLGHPRSLHTPLNKKTRVPLVRGARVPDRSWLVSPLSPGSLAVPAPGDLSGSGRIARQVASHQARASCRVTLHITRGDDGAGKRALPQIQHLARTTLRQGGRIAEVIHPLHQFAPSHDFHVFPSLARLVPFVWRGRTIRPPIASVAQSIPKLL